MSERIPQPQSAPPEPEAAEAVKSPESPKSPETAIENLRETRESLLREKSAKAAELAGLYLQGKLTSGEAGEKIDKIPDREKLVGRALASLEKMGIVQWAVNPEKGGRSMVVDLEALKAVTHDNAYKLGSIFRHPAYGGGSKVKTLYEIFGDQPVLSREQLTNKDYKEKPMFYVPQSREDALTPEAIKRADFHLGLWDSTTKGAGQKGLKLQPYPVKEGPSANYVETEAAVILFHPRYGDGYRNEKSVFMVRDRKTREYRKLSGESFLQYGISPGVLVSGRGHAKSTVRNLRQGVREFMPTLVARGLIAPQDFRAATGAKFSGKEHIVRTKVSPDGMVMFNRVRHYLGREFIGKPVRIYNLSPDLGGVAEVAESGEETLTHTFRIFSRDNIPRTPSGEQIAGRKLTEVAPFSGEKVTLPRRADETEEIYQERVRTARNFSFVLKLSNDLAPLGVALSKEDAREQAVIARAAKTLDDKKQYGRFMALAKNYGEDGVRSFFTAEYDDENGEKILTLAEKLKEEDAEALFYSYARVIDSARAFESTLRNRALAGLDIDEDLKDRLPTEIQEAIQRRAKDVLMAAYAVGVEKKGDMKVSEVVHAMEGVRTILEVLQSLEDTDTPFRFIKSEDRGETRVFLTENKETGEQFELKVFVRPVQSEKGQARVNFELNFDTMMPDESLKKVFTQSTYYKETKKTRVASSLRLSIDLDTYEDAPQVSLDLGRGPLDSENFLRPGDVLGKALALSSAMGHHNPKSFDRRYADPKVFAKVAEKFKEYIDSKNP